MLALAARVLNAGLAIVCGVVALRIGLGVSRAVHAPQDPRAGQSPRPERPGPLPAPGAARAHVPFSARAVIVERDLFHEPTLAPAQSPASEPEEIEATALPLSLLGTISSHDAQLGAAAIWNAERRQRLVVVAGDWVAGGRANVVEIERRRVLLDEGGVVRELVFDDDDPRPPKRRPLRQRRARRQRGRR